MHESFLETLLEINRQLAENRALEPLLGYTVETALHLLGAERGHLVLLNQVGVPTLYLQHTPEGQEFSKVMDLSLKRMFNQVIQGKKSVLIPPQDAGQEKALSPSSTFQIWIPLGAPGPVLGVLGLMRSGEADPFTARDGQLLELFALQAAMVIKNALLQEELAGRAAEQATRLLAYDEEFYAFSRRVAHDIRGPLTTILGFTRLLEKKLDLANARQQEQFAAIKHSAEMMDDIIQELRLLVSIRAGKYTIEFLDMGGIVAGILQRLAYRIKEYQAEIILPERWPLASGYTPWVAEVWVNLISNALKHGGRPPRVELGAEAQPDGMVRFWVRDNGSGISPDTQADLFPPQIDFRQVNARGDGLGLSVVKHIVETLGGQVVVESQVGQGSLFGFTLPKITD